MWGAAKLQIAALEFLEWFPSRRHAVKELPSEVSRLVHLHVQQVDLVSETQN